MMTWLIVNAWPLSYLTIAVVDDLVYKKFHNALFLLLTFVGIIYAFSLSPLSWQDSLGGFFLGGGLLLPLVLIKAVGAGDMKFMMAFGLLVGVTTTFWVVIYALAWGALLGLLKAFFGGHLSRIFHNMLAFAQFVKPVKTTKVPYTVAIMLAWLTYSQIGGLL